MIIPAIDIRDGRCVRLLHGDFNAETVYPAEPVELARQYEADGAKLLHIVDLDAAKDGSTGNRDTILSMVSALNIPVQLGGGIRDLLTAEDLLSAGIQRVVLGSVAMKRPEVAINLVSRFGVDRVCVALDVRPVDGLYEMAASGWTEPVSTKLADLLDHYADSGVVHVLMTDISRDGAMTGPNTDLYRSIAAEYPSIKLQASGGVRSMEDVREVCEAGAAAAIVGKALLTGAILLAEAN